MSTRQAVLGVENASFFYGSNRVFEGVSFQLDDARTALVGENGAGKSTLLKCLLGELVLMDGQIVRSRGLKIGYVPQDVPEGLAATPLRQVLEAALPVTDGSEDWKVDVLLDEIGVAFETAEQPFGALSGGWQRLMLIAAAARLSEPDLLILDEPTNHLDLSNINVLEGWLEENQRLPMLIVSHDRAFLQRTTTRTLFLRADGAHSFAAPFVEARQALLHRDAADAARRHLEGKEIERLQKVAARYRVWGVKNDKFHKRAKATEKRIDRIEAERTGSYVSRERKLELAEGEIEAKVALRIENYAVTTPDGGRKLFHIDKLSVRVGDRIALLGVNGAGKSMLLSALARSWDPALQHYDGGAQLRFNPQSRLVYFDQRMADLPLKVSLVDYLTSVEGATSRDANAMLAKAGFPYVRIKGPIGDLSHGERARLVFLRMTLAKPNLYLLDEPTNHLDIEGQEDLEAQLEASEVACLFVSHDRYFTRAAATRFLEIRKGRLVEVEGPEAFFEAQ
ncbi:ABC-F family ATP-binding cassette domain-containing protein [Phenylobacterium sp.]|uniref:ABC-F family ATP-binding cassette domain-containing protein n=1 Tax=Phenylobacterium sp. TaxID=1871053 RepID=UPI002736CAE2|nr:ABC-F family ATP-binding cassette domain-containing protein [Phenylobacterium sp.]MDP3854332.1 ABC-F family ATP-binding cassette domain-containing protein [Phenylobacterium sp.]